MATEQSWKTPTVGDTLTLPDGRVWRVIDIGRPDAKPWQRISYTYTNAAGQERTAGPYYDTWRSRIAKQVKNGATYERVRRIATVEVPVVDELPEGAVMGDLVSWDGKLCARQIDGSGWSSRRERRGEVRHPPAAGRLADRTAHADRP